MYKVLIFTNSLSSPIDNKFKDYICVTLNTYPADINCFHAMTPVQEIVFSDKYLCFIPYSVENGWEYKQRARAARYNLGNDECQIIENDFTYPIHYKLKLSFEKEVSILILAVEFFIDQDCEVYLNKIPSIDEVQDKYLRGLIDNGKIKVLNE